MRICMHMSTLKGCAHQCRLCLRCFSNLPVPPVVLCLLPVKRVIIVVILEGSIAKVIILSCIVGSSPCTVTVPISQLQHEIPMPSGLQIADAMDVLSPAQQKNLQGSCSSMHSDNASWDQLAARVGLTTCPKELKTEMCLSHNATMQIGDV